jgi:hypothetical protein
MPASPPVLLAGRLWSSSDGKGRDKYPMVLCAEFDELPAGVLTMAFPFLAVVHERCASTTSADDVRSIVSSEGDQLRKYIKDPVPQAQPLTVKEFLAVARHPDLQKPAAAAGQPAAAETSAHGFHRIVYGFASVLSAYRPNARNAGRRPEQLRLPTCGLSAPEALFFWYRFAFSFLDVATPLLLFAPDQSISSGNGAPPAASPWVDLIAGEPAPQNLFCIKAGTRFVPFTSDIPYTLDLPFIRAVDNYLAQCATLPENSPLPAWPI